MDNGLLGIYVPESLNPQHRTNKSENRDIAYVVGR